MLKSRLGRMITANDEGIESLELYACRKYLLQPVRWLRDALAEYWHSMNSHHLPLSSSWSVARRPALVMLFLLLVYGLTETFLLFLICEA
jgi:hypothetical protein